MIYYMYVASNYIGYRLNRITYDLIEGIIFGFVKVWGKSVERSSGNKLLRFLQLCILMRFLDYVRDPKYLVINFYKRVETGDRIHSRRSRWYIITYMSLRNDNATNFFV